MSKNIMQDAEQLSEQLRDEGCGHLGLVTVAPDGDALVVHWHERRLIVADLPKSFHGRTVKVKRIGGPVPKPGHHLV